MRYPAFALIALALAVRLLVPAGWMPSGERAFAITVCAGIDTQTVWLDRQGTIHKTDPSEKKDGSEGAKDCAFANAGVAAILFASDSGTAATNTVLNPPNVPAIDVAIGRGLAAPPPPSTGPPTLI